MYFIDLLIDPKFRNYTAARKKKTMQEFQKCPTDCLHGVPLLDEELRSGNVNVHPERLLLLVHSVRRPGVLAEVCILIRRSKVSLEHLCVKNE